MIAKSNQIIDGQYYEEGEEIWDLGSLECVDVIGGKRKYQGLSKDANKLPPYVASGSSCIMLDTNDAYIFHGKSSRWVKM